MKIALAIVIVMATMVFALPMALASITTEQEFVYLANVERTALNIDALPTSAGLVAAAREHSQRMADSNHLHHNPNLGSGVSVWKRLGENVGRGGDARSIHTAFMNSDGHRRNIIDPGWTDMGVGVVEDDGIIWVTQVFREAEGEIVSGTTYTDEDEISPAHIDAVLRLHDQGIMIGKRDGSFGPNDYITRQQFATVIDRILN